MIGFNTELTYPSHVMKLTNRFDGQHDSQNGTITYLSKYKKMRGMSAIKKCQEIERGQEFERLDDNENCVQTIAMMMMMMMVKASEGGGKALFS